MHIKNICFLLLFGVAMQAQEEEYVVPYLQNADNIYKEYIKFPRLIANGEVFGYPVIELGGGGLELTFDDIEADLKDFSYTIIHCNSDWTNSAYLNEMDYIKGYRENRMNTGENSLNTLYTYSHYALKLPNENISFALPGNYILKVYTTGDEQDLVLTRRFMVSAGSMQIEAQANRASDVSKLFSHQEVDFKVKHKGIDIRNPSAEIKVVILQNGRWDSAITISDPLYARSDELSYDFQDKIVFPAGKEFRPLDLRNFTYRGGQVKSIEKRLADWNVDLKDDLSRNGKPYFFLRDANGHFVPQNMDYQDDDLRADYAKVTFHLKTPLQPNGSVYIIGGFSDWLIRPENKCDYDYRNEEYSVTSRFKQGYYDYLYAFVPDKSSTPDISLFEGDRYETENEYLILVYYKPLGERYERLAAYKIFKVFN